MYDPGTRDKHKLMVRTPKTELGYYKYVNEVIVKEELVKKLCKQVKVDKVTVEKVKYTFHELMLKGYVNMQLRID